MDRFKISCLHDDKANVIALIQPQYFLKTKFDETDLKTKKASINFANKGNLPLFYNFYYDPNMADNYYGDKWQFKLFPVNDLAFKTLDKPYQMTDLDYNKFLYKLRNIKESDYYNSKCDNTRLKIPFIKNNDFYL